MSFFTTIFLYFLPLIAIPIIIHLLGKNRIKTVRFSSLKFLNQLKNDTIKKLKLRQIILLILRTLLILFIILFFARPFVISRESNFLPQQGEKLILLIDNSHSLSETYRDRTLLQEKLEELSALGKKIQYPVSLNIVYTTVPDSVFDQGIINKAEEFSDRLNRISITHQEAHLNRALEHIEKYLKKSDLLTANLWILSDFQQSEYFQENLSANLSRLTKNQGIKTTLFPVRHKENNVAISDVNFPSQIVKKEKSIMLETRLNWWQKYSKATISLFFEGQRVAQNITTGENQKTEFEFVPQKTGKLTGEISIPPDALMQDNRFYFAMDIPEQVKVLLISDNDKNAKLIEKALKVDKKEIISLQTISPQILAMENLNDYDVLIFHGISSLPAIYVQRLEDFFNRGKGLIYFPTNHTNLKEYNHFWHEKIGLPRWKNTLHSSGENYQKIGNINQHHPVFSQVWLNKQSFNPGSRFYSLPVFQNNNNQTWLINYANQLPFLLESDKKLTLAALISPSESDFWLSGFFPVLLQQMIFYLTNSEDSFQNFYIGDTLIYRNFDPEEIETYSMKTPDNKSYLLTPDKNNSSLIFIKTEIPGFYKLYRQDQLLENFAVNISRTERSNNFLPNNTLHSLIAKQEQNILVIGETGNKTNFKINKELSGIFLLFILSLLVAETLLARINYNSKTKRTK